MTTLRLPRPLLPLLALALTALACSPDLSVLFTPTPIPPTRPAAAPPPTQVVATPTPETPTLTPTPQPGDSSVPPAEMAESLRAAAPPVFDPLRWGVEVGLLKPGTPRTRKTAPQWEVGDTETFSVGLADSADAALFGIDPLTGEEVEPDTVEVETELRLVTDLFYVWLDTSAAEEVSDKTLEAAAESFAATGYALAQQVGVSEWTPGMDRDPRLHLVYVRGLGAGEAARFRRLDEYPVAVYRPSSEREVIFINLDEVTPGEARDTAALTRAYWQMAQFNLDANEPRWAVEGQAQVAQNMAGFGEAGPAAAFIAASDTRLNFWPQSPDEGASLASSGASYLYHLYLLERVVASLGEAGSGGETSPSLDFLADLAGSPLDGLAAVDEALAAAGLSASADDLFFDWTVANLIDDASAGQGQYSYSGVEAGNPCPVVPLDILPQTATYQIEPYSASYHELQGGTRLSLEFAGQTSSPLLPEGPFDGGVAWWSGRGEWVEAILTRSLDLSELADATLDFALWYDIQTGQDAAYVLLSTDKGETWTALAGPHSVTLRGLPAFTGVSGGGEQPTWLQERIDLTPFVGQEALLRFVYITDGSQTGPGLMLDNISIPQLGFFDGAEALDPGWEAEGWLRTSNSVANRWGLYLVTEESGQLGGTLHTVTPIAVSAEGQASLEQALPEGVTRSWVVVALASPGTDFPAEYTLTIDGDFTLISPPGLAANTLAVENFDTSCGLFRQVATPRFADTITESAFSVQVNQPGDMHIALLDVDSFEDVVISVDTTLPAAPASDSAWGAVCRYADSDNYYAFQIRGDGSHRIYAVIDGAPTDLSPFQAADAIQTGPGAANNVVAACVGQTLSLTVNGQVVASAEDASLTSGQVGLLVATGLNAPASVQFDSFLLSGPTGAGTPGAAAPAPEAAVCDCSGNIYNCRDFSGRAEAQACFDFCGGRANDVHLLDADGNGIVCETVFP